MKKILIADSSKASLVMTSEVFKDHFPGVQVVVAKTSSECLELVKSTADVDAYIIDFDLPDKDGAATAAQIKRHCQTPVLITAFDRADVHQAIHSEVAAFDDCQNWLRKPVRAETLVSVAKRFIEGRYRTHRRINCHIPLMAKVTLSFTMTKMVETLSSPVSKIKKTRAMASKLKAASTAHKNSVKKTQDKKTKIRPVAAIATKSRIGKETAPKAIATKATATKATATKATATKATATKATATKPTATKATVTTELQSKTAQKITQTTEKITQKLVVPGYIIDSSIGGICIKLDYSALEQALATSNTGAISGVKLQAENGQIVEFYIPSDDVLRDGNKKSLEKWQENFFALSNSNQKSKAKSTTLTNISKSTVKTAADQNKLKDIEKNDAVLVKGTVCWLSEKGAGFATLGLQLGNAAAAKKIFDAALQKVVPAFTGNPTESAKTNTTLSISSLRMPQRGSGYSNSGKN